MQKFVKPAAMNASSMITTTAKNVPKPALNVRKNAGKWHPELVNQQSMLVLFSLCDELGTNECRMLQYPEFALQGQRGKSRSSALPENRPGIQKR
ncbi:hypothetical protein AB5I83_03425 [Mesobacillus sp. LC4]